MENRSMVETDSVEQIEPTTPQLKEEADGAGIP
jgi:hypothetical protein